jgi:predicted ATP-dependent serine protease
MRLKEAGRMGFEQAFIPQNALSEIREPGPMKLLGIQSVHALYDYFR